jgi:hypothetical protein
MAALLEVGDALARVHPANAVYVGLALGVCAGSPWPSGTAWLRSVTDYEPPEAQKQALTVGIGAVIPVYVIST